MKVEVDLAQPCALLTWQHASSTPCHRISCKAVVYHANYTDNAEEEEESARRIDVSL